MRILCRRSFGGPNAGTIQSILGDSGLGCVPGHHSLDLQTGGVLVPGFQVGGGFVAGIDDFVLCSVGVAGDDGAISRASSYVLGSRRGRKRRPADIDRNARELCGHLVDWLLDDPVPA